MGDNQGPSTSCSSTSTPFPTPWSVLGQFAKTFPTDFTFVIGKDSHEVQSHSPFLKQRSEELKVVVQLSTDQRIKLDKWDPKVFEAFHEYLYTEELETQGFSDEEIVQLMKLGYRYCFREREKICEKVIAGSIITLQNAYRLYQEAINWDLPVLKNAALKFIAGVNKDAERFLNTEDFLKMNEFSLRQMLEPDELRCSEVKLFEAVIRWGRTQLKRPEAVGPILRGTLENLINLIRFPLMSDKEMANVVFPTGLLNNEELSNILVFSLADHNNKPALMFCAKPREYPLAADHLEIQDVEAEQNEDQQYRAKQQGSNKLENSDTDLMDEGYSNSDSNSITNPIASTSQSSVACRSPANITVDSWEHFLNEIKKKCNNCSIIAKVKTDQGYPLKTLGEKICMANLQKVVLQIDMSSGNNTICLDSDEENENDPQGVKQLRANFDLEPYIFFKKNDNAVEDPLWDHKSTMEFELQINGVKFFKLSRQQKDITIGFGGDASLQLIPLLSKLAKFFQKLILVDCNMPMDPRLWCASFTEVMLWGVRDTTPSKLGKFLQKFPNLENLSCWTKREKREDGTPDKSFINLATDLVSGKKLTKLAVCYAKLILPYPVHEETVKAAKKANLFEFYTDVCHWSPHIFEHFGQMFPNLKKVSFGYCGLKFEYNEHPESNNVRAKRRKVEEKELVSYVTIRLMTNLLKIKTLEWIRVSYLYWAAEPFTHAEKSALETFLKKAGLPFGKYVPSNFLLEKNQTNGMWKGKSYKELMNTGTDAPYWDEMNILEYEQFGLDRIFQDVKASEAFETYSQESE